jgi:hypothetical protein
MQHYIERPENFIRTVNCLLSLALKVCTYCSLLFLHFFRIVDKLAGFVLLQVGQPSTLKSTY